jgi:hypothetical protein
MVDPGRSWPSDDRRQGPGRDDVPGTHNFEKRPGRDLNATWPKGPRPETEAASGEQGEISRGPRTNHRTGGREASSVVFHRGTGSYWALWRGPSLPNERRDVQRTALGKEQR